MLEKIKLAVLHGKGGCDWWRVWQPCEAMRKKGLAEIRYIFVNETNAGELAEAARWCDLFLWRGAITIEALTAIKQFKSLGTKLAVDYDDLHFNVSPWNPAYKQFGIEEVQIKDPTTGDVKYLWKDGVDGFSVKDNKKKFHSMVAIAQEVDVITTTTLYLKDALAEVCKVDPEKIRVLPNAVDFTQWRPVDIRDKFVDKFRFGWAVSNSHGEDWLSIKPSLVEFLNRHKDAKFVVMGDTSMDIQSVLPKDQLEWYPFSDLWEGHYAFRMPLLGLDCAIAPLADTEFNKCKSPLKWAEYSAFGWPVIAQKMSPYTECIVNGHNGLLADDKDAWVRCLETMYSDSNYRAKLRFEASQSCKLFFDLDKVCHQWHDVYKEAITGEPCKTSIY